LDTALLAAYAERNLSEDAVNACEEHLSLCPECLAVVRELWELPREHPRATAAMPWERLRRKRAVMVWWCTLAASLLVAIGGCLWGWWKSTQNSHSQTIITGLNRQLADARLELILACKESLFDHCASPIRPYWVMATSPRILQMPQSRGVQRLSPEALTLAAKAKQSLQAMLANHETRGNALLELAVIELATDRKPEAEAALQEAQAILGDTPDVENLRAARLLAQGDRHSVRQAETVLRELTQSKPEYVPAWYNLALLLQQSFRDAESREAWDEYLRREQRPEFREAAKAHMSAM
jgi:tetratricopeptide (TPR) repeat protein